MVTRLGLMLLAGASLVLVPILALTASAGSATVYYWGCCIAAAPLSPTVMPVPGTVVQVASSNTTQYALTSTGAVYAWGTGTDGQLGDGGTANSSTPVQVDFPAGVSIAHLPTDVMPNAGALAVDINGNVWAWGDNVAGVDCITTESEYLTPVEVPLIDVTLISSASGHALYDAGGTLYACGGNSLGELGDGTTTTHVGPVAVTGISGTVVGLASSSQDEYAMTAAGAVYAWGGNAEDELCNGSTVSDSDVPVQVPFADSAAATQISAGGSLATNGSLMVGLADGTFWACGSDTYGQLGDGGSANQSLPITVSPPAGVTYQSIAMNGATAYAIDSNGNVWAWGWDNGGQIGNGVKETAVLTPLEVLVGQGVTQMSGTAQDVVSLSSTTAPPTPTPTPTATPTPTPSPTPSPGIPALSQAFGATTAQAATSITAGTTKPTATGDLVVVTVLVRNVNALTKVGGVSDSAGDTFKGIIAVIRGTQTDEEIWDAPNSKGGANSVTVTLPAASSVSMTVLDITGANPSPVDATSTNSGTSKAATTGTAGNTQSPEIAVACLGWNSNPKLTGPTSGYTPLPVEQSAVAGSLSGEQTAYILLSGTGAQSYAGTLSASVVWTGALATFS